MLPGTGLFTAVFLPALIAAITLYRRMQDQSVVHLRIAGPTVQPTDSRVSYISGFFEHDKLPTGPEQGFRAVSVPVSGILGMY